MSSLKSWILFLKVRMWVYDKANVVVWILLKVAIQFSLPIKFSSIFNVQMLS